MRSDPRAIARALALGVMHGPAELLPISSSGHTELIPWLLGSDQHADAGPEARKAFEVALHAGTAAALLIALRGEVAESLRGLDRQRLEVLALSLLPPCAAGLVLERPVERHLGRPGSIAVALILGGIGLAWADRRPQRRGQESAKAADGLWLGVAQACALVPGISRNGATLTAARLRGFRRADAERLSRHAALPVIGGATVLKLLRLSREGLPDGMRAPFALGAGAAFGSTLCSTPLIRQLERDRSLAPIAAYRIALGALALRRIARGRRATMRP
ncbi:MAG: undecaprenyl-diphosphate phosphatase [Solirubrobacteraceae bacterium]